MWTAVTVVLLSTQDMSSGDVTPGMGRGSVLSVRSRWLLSLQWSYWEELRKNPVLSEFVRGTRRIALRNAAADRCPILQGEWRLLAKAIILSAMKKVRKVFCSSSTPFYLTLSSFHTSHLLFTSGCNSASSGFQAFALYEQSNGGVSVHEWQNLTCRLTCDWVFISFVGIGHVIRRMVWAFSDKETPSPYWFLSRKGGTFTSYLLLVISLEKISNMKCVIALIMVPWLKIWQ